MGCAIQDTGGIEVWTLDISQAFLQAANENIREIFLQPPKEMELSSDEVLKLTKPLYGLFDSGDRWHHILRYHHVQDLQMEPLDADPSLHFRSIGNRLIGLSGVYVDDMLRCRTPDFLRDSKTTSRIFDATPETMRTAKFAGVNLRQTESGIETDMSDYIEKLTFPMDQSWKHFASFRAKLAWIVYDRPDISARVAKLAQVTEQNFRTDAIKVFSNTRGCFPTSPEVRHVSQVSCS
jgi:Reverse transcriptase (RNA-dependent DNA polymerase)